MSEKKKKVRGVTVQQALHAFHLPETNGDKLKEDLRKMKACGTELVNLKADMGAVGIPTEKKALLEFGKSAKANAALVDGFLRILEANHVEEALRTPESLGRLLEDLDNRVKGAEATLATATEAHERAASVAEQHRKQLVQQNEEVHQKLDASVDDVAKLQRQVSELEQKLRSEVEARASDTQAAATRLEAEQRARAADAQKAQESKDTALAAARQEFEKQLAAARDEFQKVVAEIAGQLDDLTVDCALRDRFIEMLTTDCEYARAMFTDAQERIAELDKADEVNVGRVRVLGHHRFVLSQGQDNPERIALLIDLGSVNDRDLPQAWTERVTRNDIDTMELSPVPTFDDVLPEQGAVSAGSEPTPTQPSTADAGATPPPSNGGATVADSGLGNE